MDVVFHIGIDHPDLGWLLVTAALSAVAGGGFAAYLVRRTRRAESRAEATSSDG